jgi:hypothetical protein
MGRSSGGGTGAGRRGVCMGPGTMVRPRRGTGTGRLTSMGMDRARTLVQLGLDLPDSVFQPPQQELKDVGETVVLHFGDILEGDLASIEIVNHVHHGHRSLLPW